MSGQKAVAVLWDMDGTLIDSEPLHQASLLNVLKSQKITWQDSMHEDLLGLDDYGVHAYCTERLGMQLGWAQWNEMRLDYYLQHTQRLEPRRQCWDLFKQMHEQGTAQAIVSNASTAMLHANARALGLNPSEWVFVSRDDVSQGKPHPEPYFLGALRLGISSACCLVVEDSVPGAMSGLHAGARVLFWPQDPNTPGVPPPVPCRSLVQAKNFLDNAIRRTAL